MAGNNTLELTVPSETYIAALGHGYSWTGRTMTPAAITFYIGSTERDGTKVLSPPEHQALNDALNAISSVANLRFTQVLNPDQADIRFSEMEMRSGLLGLTYTWFQGSTVTNADVIITSLPLNYYGEGIEQAVFIHEILHALGLKHPGNYSGDETGPFLEGSDDSWDHTIMSYRSGAFAKSISEVKTPMAYDIATLQFLYGSNMSTNSGNTTYSMNGANQVSTLWDAAGNDTLETTQVGEDVVIDLRSGADHPSLAGKQAYWIAYGASIENAISGSGNDQLLGNAGTNNLHSGEGDDTLRGYEGNDTISGGGGADSLCGNQGNDILYGQDGNDSVLAGKDRDFVFGNQGNDTVNGNNDNDTVYGGEGDDEVHGGKANDLVIGDDGNDRLFGDLDNDTLIGGQGVDMFCFAPGCGQDTIRDFGLEDFLSISTAYGLSISQILQDITYTPHEAIVHLGNDAVTLLGISLPLSSGDIQLI